MGHHDEEQDNKKATPTTDMAPGAPLWYAAATGVHHQKDFGPGYDSHDPVGLHKGTFIRGNAVDRFGTIGFRFDKYAAGHGKVIELVIDRKGGAKTDQAVVISVDRDSKGDGNDYNTGSVGIYNSLVVDGFGSNNIDLDLKTLNTDPSRFSYDDENHRLTVNCPDGEDELKVKVLVPYRTSVSKLLPVVLNQPITYRVDEYMHLGMKRNELPSAFVEGDWGDLIVDEPDNIVIYNHQTNYSIMTLPLPGYFVEKGDPALLGGYETELERWNTVSAPFTADSLFYTIGKTRSVEGTSYIRTSTLYPAQSASSFWSSLSGYVTDGTLTDVGIHHVYNGDKSEYQEYIGTDTVLVSSLPANSTVGLTAHTFGTMTTGQVGSVWTSKSIKLGTDPDTDINIIHTPRPGDSLLWNELPELDPGGDSEFLHFSLPTHEMFNYGNNVTGAGHMVQAMFKHRGVDSASVPSLKYCVNKDIKASDYVLSFPLNAGNIISAALSGRAQPLSADGSSMEIGTGLLLEAGATLLTQWVTQNTETTACSAELNTTDYDKELVLYDMTQLSNSPTDYNINEQELAGYYITCNNHIDRVIHLQLTSDNAEPAHEWGEQKVMITIEHASVYDTMKHASYDSTINVKNQIKHDENAGVTYQPGDNWTDGASGPGLIEAAFGLPIALTITPTFTGYDTIGPLSADDVTFLGLAPGFGSAAALKAANDAANVVQGYIALSGFEHTNKSELDDGTIIPYYANDQIVGNSVDIDQLTAANPKYLYMSNPGDTPITVIMDIPILNGAATPLGDSNGVSGSPYFHGIGDVLDNATVDSLGGGGTGPWRFILQPNNGTDVIWQINNIIAETTQIIQTQTPGGVLQTATITYK